METKQLRRIPSKSIIGGVAAGVAEYFGIDTGLTRFLFVVLLIFGGGFPMFLVYIILWAALPKVDLSHDYITVTSAEGTSAPVPFQNRKGVEVFGYILVGIGALLLFDKIFYWIHFQKFIPSMILIGIGAYLIFRHSQNQTPPNESTTSYGPMTYEDTTNNETH
jgi:phage shock protein C